MHAHPQPLIHMHAPHTRGPHKHARIALGHTCPVGLWSLATVMSIFSNTVQTGEKPWPSALLSEPVHHCHSGSVVQNSSFLSRWSPPDWTCSVQPLISLSGVPTDSLLLQLIPVCWPRYGPMPAICALAVGGRLVRKSFDRCNDGVIHMGILTPLKHNHMHEIATCWNGNAWLWRENAQILQFTGRDGDVGEAHTSQLPDQTGCPTSPASVHEHSPFFFFSFLHHMCEFYHNGWGFQRILDRSNKPQQAVNPASQPPTETGTVGGEVRVGIGI